MTSPAPMAASPVRVSLMKQKPEWTDTIISNFYDALETHKDADSPLTMAAITALTSVLSLSTATTTHNLRQDLATAATTLSVLDNSIEIRSACELFQYYTTRSWADLQDFELLKKKLRQRGTLFQENADNSGKKIARLASGFIRDNMTVLTHGYSPLVNSLLLAAHKLGRRFRVIVTESRPGASTLKTTEELLENTIPVTIIPDSSVALVMGDVDMVLVGAVGVFENGGILNQVGTYQISIVAASLGKPVYCAAQSFKFTRLYPLSQKDLPHNIQHPNTGNTPSFSSLKDRFPDFTYQTLPFDYTPPNYLKLLFTDLGVLTPAAVSDELIKLYGI